MASALAALPVPMSKKRERAATDLIDDEYIKSKRLLQDGFRTMSLAEEDISQQQWALPSAGDLCGDDQSVCESEPLNRLNSTETTISEEESDDDRGHLHQQEEPLLSIIKGGRRQYARRVDFLVDELIRKSQRTAIDSFHTEAVIPSSVGPHPAVDHALSLFLPPAQSVFQPIAEKEIVCASAPATSARSQEREHLRPSRPNRPNPARYSGDVTHSDWEIEEINSDEVNSDEVQTLVPRFMRREHSPDISDESDMALCDDCPPGAYGSRDFHDSSISTVESDDEAAHTMEMCSDDRYFQHPDISTAAHQEPGPPGSARAAPV